MVRVEAKIIHERQVPWGSHPLYNYFNIHYKFINHDAGSKRIPTKVIEEFRRLRLEGKEIQFEDLKFYFSSKVFNLLSKTGFGRDLDLRGVQIHMENLLKDLESFSERPHLILNLQIEELFITNLENRFKRHLQEMKELEKGRTENGKWRLYNNTGGQKSIKQLEFDLTTSFAQAFLEFNEVLFIDKFPFNAYKLFISLLRSKKYEFVRLGTRFGIKKFLGGKDFVMRVKDSLLVKGLTEAEKQVLLEAISNKVKIIEREEGAELLPITTGRYDEIIITHLYYLPYDLHPKHEHLEAKNHGIYIYIGMPEQEEDSFILFPPPKVGSEDANLQAAPGCHDAVNYFSRLFQDMYGGRIYRATIKYDKESKKVTIAITGLLESFDGSKMDYFVRPQDLPKILTACKKALTGYGFKEVDILRFEKINLL